MSTANPAYASGALGEPGNPFRWVFLGLAVMFVLIGVGVLLSILTSAPQTWFMAPMGTWAPIWSSVVGAFVFAIFVLIAVSIVRRILYGWGPGYSYRGFYRHFGGWGPDSAVGLARERFARGEITRDQLNQILTDLETHGTPRYP